MAASIHDQHVEMDATEARQGRRGRHAFWILAVSTTLAGTAVFLTWMWHADKLNSVTQPSPAPADGHSYQGKAYQGHKI